MNNELIERIDFCLTHIALGLTVTHILEECKAALSQQQEAEPVAWTLRWPLDIKRGTVNYMTTFGTKERAREYADKCTDGESIVVAPLTLHQPKPAEHQGWYCSHCKRGVDCSEVTYNEQHQECGRVITYDEPPAAQPARCEYCDGSGDVHSFDGEWLGSCAECLPAAQPIDADELSNFIRKIDGNHSMGAGVLAENIVEWIGKQAAQPKVLDAINVHPILQKEVDEFIASESCYDPEHPRSSEHDYILVDDLRDWMAGHVRVPVETIRRAIYALERFANDTVAGRNSAHELRELLTAVKEEN